MTNINLLPWREAKREREKKQFVTHVAFGLLVAMGVVILLNFYAKNLIDSQTHRNQVLTDEITKLNGQIKEIAELKKLRKALIARMTIVKDLQAKRTLTVRLFDELVKIMPDGVYLTKIERKGDKITLFGYAESNTNVSQLMRKIETNEWIQNPELTEIKKTKEDRPQVENEFKLSFNLRVNTRL